LDEALANVEGLEQYRLVQELLKRVQLDVIGEDGQGTKVARNAGGLLQGLFGRGVAITVTNVPVIQPERSGKFLLAKRDFPLYPGMATVRTEVLHG
jgi:hypothetical protein